MYAHIAVCVCLCVVVCLNNCLCVFSCFFVLYFFLVFNKPSLFDKKNCLNNNMMSLCTLLVCLRSTSEGLSFSIGTIISNSVTNAHLRPTIDGLLFIAVTVPSIKEIRRIPGEVTDN